MTLCEKRLRRAERAAERGDVPACEKWIGLARKAGSLARYPVAVLLMRANKMAMRCGVIRLAA
jgi:hypothetical protein